MQARVLGRDKPGARGGLEERTSEYKAQGRSTALWQSRSGHSHRPFRALSPSHPQTQTQTHKIHEPQSFHQTRPALGCPEVVSEPQPPLSSTAPAVHLRRATRDGLRITNQARCVKASSTAWPHGSAHRQHPPRQLRPQMTSTPARKAWRRPKVPRCQRWHACMPLLRRVAAGGASRALDAGAQREWKRDSRD